MAGDGPHYPGWRHIAFKVDSVDATLAAMGADAQVTLGPMDFDAFIQGWRTVGSPIRTATSSRSARDSKTSNPAPGNLGAGTPAPTAKRR